MCFSAIGSVLLVTVLTSGPCVSFRSNSPSRRSRRWGAQLTCWTVHPTILNSMSWTGLSHYRGSCVGEPPSFISFIFVNMLLFFFLKVWLKNKISGDRDAHLYHNADLSNTMDTDVKLYNFKLNGLNFFPMKHCCKMSNKTVCSLILLQWCFLLM